MRMCVYYLGIKMFLGKRIILLPLTPLHKNSLDNQAIRISYLDGLMI